MKILRQIAAHIRTGTTVATRLVPEDELEPPIWRDNPGLVELSRAEPTRGSVVFIFRTHRICHRLPSADHAEVKVQPLQAHCDIQDEISRLFRELKSDERGEGVDRIRAR